MAGKSFVMDIQEGGNLCPNGSDTRIKKAEGNTLSSKAKNRMKRELSVEKPTVCIGKEGASLNAINEISDQLKRKKIVKVRILTSALKGQCAKDIALEAAQKSSSTLIDVRGHTFTLHKPHKKKPQSLPKKTALRPKG